MADVTQLRNEVEQAISAKLSDRLEELRQDIVDQLLAELEPVLARASEPENNNGAGALDALCRSLHSIEQSTAQADILNALLEGVSQFAARIALFVVRGTTLAGWQARGLVDNNIRGWAVDATQGSAARVLQQQAQQASSASEFDASFVAREGLVDSTITLLPLVVKERVVAVLFCQGGSDGIQRPELSAIEALCSHTCLWLEHSAGKRAANSQPTQTTSGPNGGVHSVSADPALASAEPDELHKKALRFAKLLVEEIKLYNGAKLAEGKQNRNIYRLLKDDLEKSRATYEKRYGGTPAAPAKYFDSEVVRILADNDRALLGDDFPG